MKLRPILCAALLAPITAWGSVDACPAKGQFKGLELYSWKSASDDWMFALLPGTNRNKTEPEIKVHNGCVLSAGELAAAFGRLSEEDQVFWVENERLNVELPTRQIVEHVVGLGKNAGVMVHIVRAK